MTGTSITSPNAARSFFVQIAAVAAGATVIALGAQTRLDLGFTPIPVTLQVLGVLLCGLVLGAQFGSASCLLYLGAGIAGLPVFAGAGGGFSYVFDWRHGVFAPTAGYLLAFPAAAYVTGLLHEQRPDAAAFWAMVSGLAGVAVIYCGGFCWLFAQQVAALGFRDGLIASSGQGVLPFVLLDIAKASVAALVVLYPRASVPLFPSGKR